MPKINTPTDFANALLGALGVPDTKTNVANVVAWENTEGGHWHNPDKYNPLDMSQPEPGSHPTNSSGIQAYSSWQQGIDATVHTLEAGNYGYSNIITALNSNADWNSFVDGISKSGMGGIPKASNNYIGTPSILKYKTANDLPPGSGGAGSVTTNAQLYSQAGAQQTRDGNNPSSTPGALSLTGMAGILQALDAMYNPGEPSLWKSVTSIGTADIKYVSILVFTRGISALLSVGLMAIGLHTMLTGSSSGGSAGSGNTVIEFVNNQQRQKITTARLAQSEARIKERVAREQDTQRRHTERINFGRERETARNSRSNRWADIHETYATNPK